MLSAQIDKAKRTVMPVTQSLQDFVVLLSQIVGRRILQESQPHVDAQSVNAQTIGVFDQLGHPFVGRSSRHAREMTVQIPDHAFTSVPTKMPAGRPSPAA